jgi:hypothetical protein
MRSLNTVTRIQSFQLSTTVFEFQHFEIDSIADRCWRLLCSNALGIHDKRNRTTTHNQGEAGDDGPLFVTVQ